MAQSQHRQSHDERPRYAPRVPVQCRVIFQSETGLGEGTVLNLSLPGAAVERHSSVPLGRYLKLNVFLPDQHPSLKVMQAAVRWENGQQFGVEFLHLSDTAEDRLIGFLTTPQPHPGEPSQ
jgi:PilZ domain-containing protein